jgi:hypothetical protein
MALVGGAMLLSLLSKSMGVILPALFLVLDYWPLKRFPIRETTRPLTLSVSPDGGEGNWMADCWRGAARLVAEKIPLFMLSGLFTFLTLRAESNVGALNTLKQFSIDDRVLNVISVIPLYLKNVLIPSGLSVFYPHRIYTPVQLLALITVTVLLAWVIIRNLRRRKEISAGLLWFIVALAPVIGIVKIGSHVMADRYTYIPQIGLFTAVVWTIGSWRWLNRKRAIWLVSTASVVLLLLTHRQLSYWKNDLALALNGERVTGKNALVCFNLGIGYDAAGAPEQSLKCFREVLEYSFDYPGVHYNSARACVLTGRPKLALMHLDLAFRQSPYEPLYHNLLAEVLSTSSDSAVRNGRKAVEHASLACRLTPEGNSLYLDTLAAAYAEAGEFPQAVAIATRAMKLTRSTKVQAAIRSRIELYSKTKPFRGILLHDAVARRS